MRRTFEAGLQLKVLSGGFVEYRMKRGGARLQFVEFFGDAGCAAADICIYSYELVCMETPRQLLCARYHRGGRVVMALWKYIRVFQQWYEAAGSRITHHVDLIPRSQLGASTQPHTQTVIGIADEKQRARRPSHDAADTHVMTGKPLGCKIEYAVYCHAVPWVELGGSITRMSPGPGTNS